MIKYRALIFTWNVFNMYKGHHIYCAVFPLQISTGLYPHSRQSIYLYFLSQKCTFPYSLSFCVYFIFFFNFIYGYLFPCSWIYLYLHLHPRISFVSIFLHLWIYFYLLTLYINLPMNLLLSICVYIILHEPSLWMYPRIYFYLFVYPCLYNLLSVILLLSLRLCTFV